MIYTSETWHHDIAARLRTVPFLADVTVLMQTPGIVDADILQALSTLNETGGKIGACVLVMVPRETVTSRDLPGPELRVEGVARVFTQALFNLGDTGTGKSNAAIRRAVRHALHLWSPTGAQQISCDKNAGTPLDADGENDIEIYDIEFSMLLPEPTVPAFLPAPKITGLSSTTYTLEARVGSPENALIYITEDGTFPGPSNAAARAIAKVAADLSLLDPDTGLPIVGPFTAGSPGITLRAALHKTGALGSNITTQTL